MRRIVVSVGALLGFAGTVRAGDLADPVVLSSEKGVIDVRIGHAAPLAADLDGDGLLDLLVGQFGGGTVLRFRNVGTKSSPKLSDPVEVRSATEELRVPSG